MYAQGANNSKVEITQPEGLNFDTSQYSQTLNSLRGLPASDPKVATLAKQISEDIRKKKDTHLPLLCQLPQQMEPYPSTFCQAERVKVLCLEMNG